MVSFLKSLQIGTNLTEVGNSCSLPMPIGSTFGLKSEAAPMQDMTEESCVREVDCRSVFQSSMEGAATVRPQRILFFVSALFVLAVAGCGGGSSPSSSSSSSSSSSGGTNSIPVGIYAGTGTFTGTQTINGATSAFSTSPFLLGFVTSTGSYMLLSYSSGSPNTVSQIDQGTGSASNGVFAARDNLEFGLYPNYNSNDFPILGGTQGATLSASIDLNTGLIGSINYPGTEGDVLSFPLNYAAASTTQATLSDIARSYSGAFYANVNTGENINLVATSTFTISAAGALSGSVTCPFTPVQPPPMPTGCTVSGTVTARTDLNAYDFSITFANGTDSFPSTWVGKTATGLGYYDPVSAKLMFGAVAADNTAFAFSN